MVGDFALVSSDAPVCPLPNKFFVIRKFYEVVVPFPTKYSADAAIVAVKIKIFRAVPTSAVDDPLLIRAQLARLAERTNSPDSEIFPTFAAVRILCTARLEL